MSFPLLKAGRSLVLVLLVWAWLGTPVGVADPPADLPNTAAPIITDSAVPLPPGQLAIQPFWSLSFMGGQFSRNWQRQGAGGDFTSFETLLRLTYGPAPDWEAYVTAPFIQNWAGGVSQPGRQGEKSADFGGLGDFSLVVKYRLVQDAGWRPTVTGYFSVNFPTGHAARLNPARLGTDALGGHAYDFTMGLNISKWLSPVYLYANLWYSVSTACPPRPSRTALFGPLLTAVHGRDLLIANLAAEWIWTERWVGLLEVYSSWEVGGPIGGGCGPPAALLGVLPGVEYLLSPSWNFVLGAALDLAGKSSPYNCTPIFTLIYTY